MRRQRGTAPVRHKLLPQSWLEEYSPVLKLAATADAKPQLYLPARQCVLLLQDVRRKLVRRYARQTLQARGTSAAAAVQGAVAERPPQSVGLQR